MKDSHQSAGEALLTKRSTGQKHKWQAKDLCRQVFKPMSPGGFRSSLLTLSCSMMGVGYLTLPEMGKTNGLAPMVFLLFVSAFVSAFANLQLGAAFRATKSSSLLKMIATVNGRASGLLCITALIFDIWVTIGAMYIFGAKFGISIIDNFDIRPEWAKSDNDLGNYIILATFAVSFMGSLAGKMSSLRYFSFITAVISLGVGCLVIFQVPKISDFYRNTLGAEYSQGRFNNYIFSAYCLSLFATNNQYSVVTVLNEFDSPTKKRVNMLVFWGTIIPLVVYLLVSIGGFLTCGNLCKDVIINRLTPLGFDDILMDVCKLLLIVCLVFGNILRNQSNRSSIMDLWEQYKLYRLEKYIDSTRGKNDAPGDQENLQPAVEQGTNNHEEVGKAVATKEVQQQENVRDNVSFFKVVLPLQFVNCLVPAAAAILAKDSLIKYVATGTGFLAPIFMIVYPCLITIRLHQSNVLRLSMSKYRLIWAYLILLTSFTYIALVINLIADDPEIN